MVFFLCFLISGFWVQAAQAACTTEGDIAYNACDHVPQYCNGTNWIAMGAFSPRTMTAMTFDGTNDYIRVASSLTASDSAYISGSFWIRRTADANVTEAIFTQAGGPPNTGVYLVSQSGSEYIDIVFNTTGPSPDMDIKTDGSIPFDGNWYHVMFAIDDSTDTASVYINGVQQTLSVGILDPYTGPVMWRPNYSGNFNFTVLSAGVGANTSNNLGDNKLAADLADVWIDYHTFLNLTSSTVRDKFYKCGRPVYLGSDGSIPTGSAPELFLSGLASTWHTNDGTGGGMTVTGALVEASSGLNYYVANAGTCSSPTGNEGDMLYNSASHVPQYCNGAGWLALGRIQSGAAGGGCSSPTGSEGDMLYNDTSNVIQYCDSNVWRAIGK